jgi:hypothetical protein
MVAAGSRLDWPIGRYNQAANFVPSTAENSTSIRSIVTYPLCSSFFPKFTHKLRYRSADLWAAIFLKIMNSFDRNFFLVWPLLTKLSKLPFLYIHSSRIGVNIKFRCLTLREPLRVSEGEPSIGICRGHESIGLRSSPALRNGLLYSFISASANGRKVAPGRNFSTNILSRKTMSSPAAQPSRHSQWTSMAVRQGNRVWGGPPPIP